MTLQVMYLAILIGAVLVSVAIFTSVISFRSGAPLLLVFLVVGLAAGEDGIGGIEFDNAGTAYFIGAVALALILFDSGFATPLKTLRSAAAPAVVLATLGVVLTTGLVGVAAHLLLPFTWLESFLLGAILSSTDAAAVFFLLRAGGITLRERVRATLEIESSSNDPMAIFLTIALVGIIARGVEGGGAIVELVEEFGLEFGLGAGLGLAGGYVVARLIDRAELDSGLYPILFLALALVLFAVTSLLHGSGFLAVYVAGLIVGNSRMRHGPGLRRFSEALTWLSQIGMFLILGLLATPSEFPGVAIPGLALAAFLIFIARPLAIWLCLLPFRFSRYEVAFIAWVGLRGAVSVLLSILPVIGGLANGQVFFNVTFIVVLASLLVQGWSIRLVARWLGMIVPARHGPVQRLQLELPGGDHEMVAYRVHPESRVAKGERIPRWARPSLLVRDGVSLRPHNAGRPQPGDQIYIIATPNYLPLLDRLFAAPAESPTDPNLYGEFALSPDARLGDVAAAYDFAVDPADAELTLRAYLRRALAGEIELGDRVTVGSVALIVRSVDDAHAIEEVGLSVEPTEPSLPRLPVFQGRKEIGDWLKRWRDRRLAPKAEPPAPAVAADEPKPDIGEPRSESS